MDSVNDNDIARQVAGARAAAAVWRETPIVERVAGLRRLRDTIAANANEIVEAICSETGKVPAEALLSEIYPVLETFSYYIKHAARLLRRRKVLTSPFNYPHAAAYVDHVPFGVVAVIAPWNLPFNLSAIPVATALVAGNAVCLKPSEWTPRCGALVGELFRAVPGWHDVIEVVQGDGSAGAALVDAAPDLVFFTGSAATGQRILAQTARSAIPAIMELGGKDPMLVFDDAPFERTVNAALYGAFCNSGQVCVSVERMYVQRSLYRNLVDGLVAKLSELRVGSGHDHELGAMTLSGQIDVVQRHYDDALQQGAKASGPLARNGRYLKPVILWDTTHAMAVMREETFGPLLPIMPFDTEADAVKLANDTSYGLNASIWTADLAKGHRIARQLHVGNCAINDVIKNIGHPGLPFGGVKRSGFGRYHGPEGLLSFCQTKSILANTGQLTTEPNWFPYSRAAYDSVMGLIDFTYSQAPLLARCRRNLPALRSFQRYFSLNIKPFFAKSG